MIHSKAEVPSVRTPTPTKKGVIVSLRFDTPAPSALEQELRKAKRSIGLQREALDSAAQLIQLLKEDVAAWKDYAAGLQGYITQYQELCAELRRGQPQPPHLPVVLQSPGAQSLN